MSRGCSWLFTACQKCPGLPTSTKGKPMITDSVFTFVKKYESNDKTYWVCSKYKVKKSVATSQKGESQQHAKRARVPIFLFSASRDIVLSAGFTRLLIWPYALPQQACKVDASQISRWKTARFSSLCLCLSLQHASWARVPKKTCHLGESLDSRPVGVVQNESYWVSWASHKDEIENIDVS